MKFYRTILAVGLCSASALIFAQKASAQTDSAPADDLELVEETAEATNALESAAVSGGYGRHHGNRGKHYGRGNRYDRYDHHDRYDKYDHHDRYDDYDQYDHHHNYDRDGCGY